MGATMKDIFHSSGNPARVMQYSTPYGALPDWLEAGLVAIRRQELTGPEVEAVSNQLATVGDPMARLCMEAPIGGGRDHGLLGALATAFLLDIGKHPAYERAINGKRVDVYSCDREWLIECGDTDANVILDHLASDCRHFAVMPFQELPEPGGRACRPFMWVFERGPEWRDATVKRMRHSIANQDWQYGDTQISGRKTPRPTT